jgi:hypothetical protein
VLNKSFSMAGITLLCVGLVGCETSDRLAIDDGHAPLISGALVVHPETWQMGERGRFKGGVEFGYERQFADSSQRIDAGHKVVIQNPQDDALLDYTFPGPQRIQNRVRVEHGHVMYKPLISAGRHFQFEPALGLGFDEFTFTTTGQTIIPPITPTLSSNSVVNRIESWNAVLGITPRFKFDQITAFEGRVRVSEGKYGGSSLVGVALVITPIKELEISGGYMWRRQEIKMPENISNIRLEADGPSVGVRFVF